MTTHNDILRAYRRQAATPEGLPDVCPKCGTAVRSTYADVDRALVRGEKPEQLQGNALDRHFYSCMQKKEVAA